MRDDVVEVSAKRKSVVYTFCSFFSIVIVFVLFMMKTESHIAAAHYRTCTTEWNRILFSRTLTFTGSCPLVELFISWQVFKKVSTATATTKKCSYAGS